MLKKAVYSGYLCLCLLIVSCHSSSPNEKNIEDLNGYWKIHQVEDKDGEIKEYKVSPNVDYIEVDSTHEGYRVKVQPQIDSTYKTSSKPEYFALTKENDSLRFHYSTTMDNWTETLLSLESDEFSVKNERGIKYTYKRFKSLKDELEAHEKAQQ